MPIVNLMEAMRTRWDVVAGPSALIYMGLKYSDIERPARACHVDLDAPGIWEQVRIAEAVALKHLNAHLKEKKKR